MGWLSAASPYIVRPSRNYSALFLAQGSQECTSRWCTTSSIFTGGDPPATSTAYAHSYSPTPSSVLASCIALSPGLRIARTYPARLPSLTMTTLVYFDNLAHTPLALLTSLSLCRPCYRGWATFDSQLWVLDASPDRTRQWATSGRMWVATLQS